MMSYSTSKHVGLYQKPKGGRKRDSFDQIFLPSVFTLFVVRIVTPLIVLRFRRWRNYVVLLVIFSYLQDVYILILCPLLFLSTEGKLFVYYHSTVMMVSWQGSVGNHHHSVFLSNFFHKASLSSFYWSILYQHIKSMFWCLYIYVLKFFLYIIHNNYNIITSNF